MGELQKIEDINKLKQILNIYKEKKNLDILISNNLDIINKENTDFLTEIKVTDKSVIIEKLDLFINNKDNILINKIKKI